MEKKKKRNILFQDPFEGEYVGNVFGWKTSFIGLFAIISLLALSFYLASTREIDPDFIKNQETIISPMDSTEHHKK